MTKPTVGLRNIIELVWLCIDDPAHFDELSKFGEFRVISALFLGFTD